MAFFGFGKQWTSRANLISTLFLFRFSFSHFIWISWINTRSQSDDGFVNILNQSLCSQTKSHFRFRFSRQFAVWSQLVGKRSAHGHNYFVSNNSKNWPWNCIFGSKCFRKWFRIFDFCVLSVFVWLVLCRIISFLFLPNAFYFEIRLVTERTSMRRRRTKFKEYSRMKSNEKRVHNKR